MKVPCYCGKYRLDPEHATYVKDGKPMCHPDTCRMVKEHGNRGLREIVDNAAFDVVHARAAAYC